MTSTYPVMNTAPADPGMALYQRFLSLGDLTGKTIQEVVVCVGQPSASTPTATHGKMLEWKAGGYQVGLEFDAFQRFVRLKPAVAAPAVKPYETVLRPGITVKSHGHSTGVRVLQFLLIVAAVVVIKVFLLVVLGQLFR